MPPSKKPPHPLAGERLRATGATEGYLIPPSGMVQLLVHGHRLKVFTVPRNISIEEAATKLEIHIKKGLETIG